MMTFKCYHKLKTIKNSDFCFVLFSVHVCYETGITLKHETQIPIQVYGNSSLSNSLCVQLWFLLERNFLLSSTTS